MYCWYTNPVLRCQNTQLHLSFSKKSKSWFTYSKWKWIISFHSKTYLRFWFQEQWKDCWARSQKKAWVQHLAGGYSWMVKAASLSLLLAENCPTTSTLKCICKAQNSIHPFQNTCWDLSVCPDSDDKEARPNPSIKKEMSNKSKNQPSYNRKHRAGEAHSRTVLRHITPATDNTKNYWEQGKHLKPY